MRILVALPLLAIWVKVASGVRHQAKAEEERHEAQAEEYAISFSAVSASASFKGCPKAGDLAPSDENHLEEIFASGPFVVDVFSDKFMIQPVQEDGHVDVLSVQPVDGKPLNLTKEMCLELILDGSNLKVDWIYAGDNCTKVLNSGQAGNQLLGIVDAVAAALKVKTATLLDASWTNYKGPEGCTADDVSLALMYAVKRGGLSWYASKGYQPCDKMSQSEEQNTMEFVLETTIGTFLRELESQVYKKLRSLQLSEKFDKYAIDSLRESGERILKLKLDTDKLFLSDSTVTFREALSSRDYPCGWVKEMNWFLTKSFMKIPYVTHRWKDFRSH